MAGSILKDSLMSINLSFNQYDKLNELIEDSYSLTQVILTMPIEYIEDISTERLYRFLSVLDDKLGKLSDLLNELDVKYIN